MRDFLASTKLPNPKLAPWLDDEMIYYNKITEETYLFESSGEWNSETISHPKLSLEARVDEPEWFDNYKLL